MTSVGGSLREGAAGEADGDRGVGAVVEFNLTDEVRAGNWFLSSGLPGDHWLTGDSFRGSERGGSVGERGKAMKDERTLVSAGMTMAGRVRALLSTSTLFSVVTFRRPAPSFDAITCTVDPLVLDGGRGKGRSGLATCGGADAAPSR